MDIYLIDQIMKGRYQTGQSILDAGAGHGRNLRWFFDNGLKVTALDLQEEAKNFIEGSYPGHGFNWALGDIAELPFKDQSFDHVMCMAVLHFANDTAHMKSMWRELARVLKPGGTLLIRSCVEMGIKNQSEHLGENRYLLPDESERYLLSLQEIEDLISANHLHQLEPLKWLNVENLRVMGTFVLGKK